MLLMEMQTVQLLWIALFLCVLQLHYSIVHAAEDDFGLAGYLPDYRIHGYNLNTSIPHYLTDLLLFSIQPHKSGMITGVCCLQGDHWELIQTSKMNHNPSLHLWVTIGGAGRADAIPFITKSSAKRQRLITSMVELRWVFAWKWYPVDIHSNNISDSLSSLAIYSILQRNLIVNNRNSMESTWIFTIRLRKTNWETTWPLYKKLRKHGIKLD